MNKKLISAIQRLYFPSGESMAAELAVCLAEGVAQCSAVSLDGMVRGMQLHFTRPADWPSLGEFCQLLQDELDLPAAAISVSAEHGFVVWFSLVQPVPLAEAQSFLSGLQKKYLQAVPQHHLCVPEMLEVAPVLHPLSGKWSAFIDPSLGSMFAQESGLEMAPNMDRQADLLASLKSIQAADFQRVLKMLTDGVTAQGLGCASADKPLCSDPREFLLAVMNDPAVSMENRIEAAKALLP
jgi:hypothetical protein